MQPLPTKILVLSGHSATHESAVAALRHVAEVVEAQGIDQAISLLRSDQFAAIFSDAGDFLPLERALVSQQASLILNTIGEGVCIVDSQGHTTWMNKRLQGWPARLHEEIRRDCVEAHQFFQKVITGPQPEQTAPHTHSSRHKRYMLSLDDQFHWEMIVSPIISPTGRVVQVVAVVWDNTAQRRLQQKLDAIDKAGSEMVRLESEAITRLSVTDRLKLLEDKIVRNVKELMHYDHFAIRILDRRTNKLEVVISSGLSPEALAIELFAAKDGSGISGYVAATGRSYICPDVKRDPRYIPGLDLARSSLTVPLQLHDKVIGVFNIESEQPAAFTEDDRQFAEIFGRYVAVALNILDLLVVERVSTRHRVADDVCSEVAGPLNDIASDAASILDDYIGHDDLRERLQQIIDNVASIRTCLNQTAQGPKAILGTDEIEGSEDDPVLRGARILVADDEPNIRMTIHDVLRKFRAQVTTASSGSEAIALVEQNHYDLVVSDIRMPDKTGYDIFAAVSRKPQTTPVILMTGFGYDPNHSIVRASQEGLQAVLFKPFKVGQLLGEIRKALQPAASR
jgi:two-component system, sensor histidine kinase SagS